MFTDDSRVGHGPVPPKYINIRRACDQASRQTRAIDDTEEGTCYVKRYEHPVFNSCDSARAIANNLQPFPPYYEPLIVRIEPKMQWKALVLALLVERGSGQQRPPMMRFSCSQLVVERLDPLVNPSAIPSPHLHQIVGGNSFNASMDPATHDLPKASTCTSCTFSEDFSNYWTAVLYFRARNGTFRRVPQIPSEGLTANGGITVYYIPSTDGKTNVTAFKPGFRMLVGDATARSPGTAQKVCHRCMPASGDNSNINCGSPDAQTLPTKFCAGGIRSVITFPTCWDGVNTDSIDHKSHLAYPTSGSSATAVGPTGTCPASHPVRIPQVMYEVMWDVSIMILSLWYS